jgi:hypothetical protein
MYLPVTCIANKKDLVTRDFQILSLQIVPEVKPYCSKKEIPFKSFLVFGSASRHLRHLDDFHPDIKIIYPPPNTTSALQPMDRVSYGHLKHSALIGPYFKQ